MSKINELRAKRAKAWETANDFLEKHRNDSGILSPEDTENYEKLENEIVDLGREIERQERMDAFEREMAAPTAKPLTERPEAAKAEAKAEEKTGRASDSYKSAFWAQARSRNGMTYEVRNALQEGTDSEGGYLVPDEFEHTLIQALNESNIIRSRARVITTSNGLHKIPVVASHGNAAWMEEEDAYTESDEAFSQVNLDAHKVGTLIKVSEELLQDSAFDLESYIRSEFSRRIGDKEEDAFLNGNGTHKPTGILNATGGAQVGVTTASATAITADEIIDLFYSLKAPYRKNAVWILNDATVKAIRKLKNGTGDYLWQPAIKDGEVPTILGRPYFTSQYAPTIEAAAKVIAFGDFSYYWIGDRQGISFKRLNELYAGNGQVGFLASKRLDGKLVLPEAIKVLQMKA